MNRSLVIPRVKEVGLPKASSYTFPKASNEAEFQSDALEEYFSSQLYRQKDLNSQVCSLLSNIKIFINNS